ncbi:MAG: spermine/spermidine N-acetyltransferase [Segetibacter sp.]|nr:spermine/spermidine N-acetyltransferase [Segetibacter sp.]
MSSFHFKVATAKDVEAVQEISRITFYQAFHGQNSKEDMDLFLKENFTATSTKKELADKNNLFLLLYQDTNLIGYVKLSESEAPADLSDLKTIEIARIYLLTNKTGKGAGALLIQKIIEVAKEKNKEAIWLGVWELNSKAIAFYEKWGFQKFGQHHFVLGKDIQNDWLMKKLL